MEALYWNIGLKFNMTCFGNSFRVDESLGFMITKPGGDRAMIVTGNVIGKNGDCAEICIVRLNQIFVC